MTGSFSIREALRGTPLKGVYQSSKLFLERLERNRTLHHARTAAHTRTHLPFRLMYAYRDNAFDLHSREMAIHLLVNYEPVEVVSFGAGERRRGEQYLTTPSFLRAVEAFHPDAIFAFDKFFTPNEVDVLKSRGILLLATSDGFNSFDADQLPQADALAMIAKYDSYLVAYAPHLAALKARRIAAEEFPLWADTELFRPLEIEKDIAVLFMGTNSGHSRPYRQPILEQISQVAKLTLAGPADQFADLPQAECIGPVKSKAEINRLFNRAKIVIGFDRLIEETRASNGKSDQILFYDVDYQVKDRTTCVMASGACYFVEDHPENRRLFQAGKELVLWSNPEDLLQKLKHFLANPTERQAIGQAARQRVIENYSSAIRAQQVINRIQALKASR